MQKINQNELKTNLRPETVDILQRNREENLHDIALGKPFIVEIKSNSCKHRQMGFQQAIMCSAQQENKKQLE